MGLVHRWLLRRRRFRPWRALFCARRTTRPTLRLHQTGAPSTPTRKSHTALYTPDFGPFFPERPSNALPTSLSCTQPTYNTMVCRSNFISSSYLGKRRRWLVVHTACPAPYRTAPHCTTIAAAAPVAHNPLIARHGGKCLHGPTKKTGWLKRQTAVGRDGDRKGRGCQTGATRGRRGTASAARPQNPVAADKAKTRISRMDYSFWSLERFFCDTHTYATQHTTSRHTLSPSPQPFLNWHYNAPLS